MPADSKAADEKPSDRGTLTPRLSTSSRSAPSRCCTCEPEKVTPEASFADDLDADSLDLVELVMALEEQFDITVDESELEGVQTVGQAFELVHSKL